MSGPYTWLLHGLACVDHVVKQRLAVSSLFASLSKSNSRNVNRLNERLHFMMPDSSGLH